MDEERFRALFDAHYGLVVAYAYRRGATWDEAHDVAAEVFTVAWRRGGAVPADAERPWLLGVARRVLANQRRGNRRRLRLIDHVARNGAPPVSLPDPQTVADADPDLARALQGLADDDREVLRLIAWEQLTHAEIGALLDLTPSAVASRVARARERLRSALDARTDVPLGGT